MASPWNALQLAAGGYAVTNRKSPGAVSAVGVDGELLRSYGPSSSSDVGPMKNPSGLAVTTHGDILVADTGNSRILAVNCSLKRALLVPIPADIGLQEPCALYLDDRRDRMYIGEGSGKYRVIVLNNASYISTETL